MTYKHAVHQGKIDRKSLLSEFLDTCEREIDGLRVRNEPNTLTLAYEIIDRYATLKKIRNYLIEWVSFESSFASTDFTSCLMEFLERILEFKIKPTEMRCWNDCWFDSHKLFLHDLFVYICAALLKNKRFDDLKAMLTHKYLLPEGYGRHDIYFGDFPVFFGTSGVIRKEIKISEDRYYISPTAELFKRNADIVDLPFDPSFMESELLLFMASILMTQSTWIPWSLLYSGYGRRPFPLFLKATKHKEFKVLSALLGFDSADVLREQYRGKIEQIGLKSSSDGHELAESVWVCANMDNLDSM